MWSHRAQTSPDEFESQIADRRVAAAHGWVLDEGEKQGYRSWVVHKVHRIVGARWVVSARGHSICGIERRIYPVGGFVWAERTRLAGDAG